jgi:flagellar motor component MotA
MQWNRGRLRNGIIEGIVLLVFGTMALKAAAQDGNAGINQANTMVRGYFDAAADLMYAVGGIIALVGAIKVFQKMNNHDHDTGKVAAAWFFACVFLVVVATVIKSFFGLT